MGKKGKPTDKERLAAGLKKLDKAANYLKTQHNSAEQYIKKAKTMYKAYYKKYGEADITKIDGDLMNELLIEKYPNAFSLKNTIHALHFVQKAVVQSKTFKQSLSLVNKKDALQFCNEHGIIRSAKDSTVRKATREEVFDTAAEAEIGRSPYAQQASKAMKIAWACSSRAEGTIEMQGKDIILNNDGTALVYLKEKGGLRRWTKVYHPEKVEYLREVKNELKNDRQTVLEPMRYDRGPKKGQIMKTDVAEKRLAKVIQGAAERIGLSNPKDKKSEDVSLHSGRKSFLSEQFEYYQQFNRKELEEMYEKRKLEMAQVQKNLQKNGDRYKITDLDKKRASAVKRVNWVNPPRNGKPGIRRTKVDRDLTDRELALFLTSIDAGHFRIDVLRYYLRSK